MALGDGQGLKFYDFEKIEDPKAYKAGYRGILDGLPITEHQANAIIVEANYAFRLIMYMFDTLEGNWFKSILKILISSIFLFLEFVYKRLLINLLKFFIDHPLNHALPEKAL